jgi:hypothetical protein
VLPSGELELYTKLGYHTIAFGRADDTMKEKFEKLKVFYREGLTKAGWEQIQNHQPQVQGTDSVRKESERRKQK